jgi:excisionase family DNA binding protein
MTGAQPQSMVEIIYTIEEAADILKVKPRTIRAWINQGKIKSFKLGDLVRIHEDDLQAVIDEARAVGRNSIEINEANHGR